MDQESRADPSGREWRVADDKKNAQHRSPYVDELVDEATVTIEPEEDALPNPLDIAPTANLALGWLDDYTALMHELTKAPPEFHRLTGLVTIAAALQHNACLKMTFGTVRPNIYGAIIAPSTVFHKSSSIQKPRQILNRAMLDKLLFSELMTSEGLLRQLQEKPAGLIIRDEIGTLFGSSRVKYLGMLTQDLTALYDGTAYNRTLSSGDVIVEKPYLNILGATTPARFHDSTTLKDWVDGFLPRWLFAVPEGEPDFESTAGLYTDEHEGEMNRLAKHLYDLANKDPRDFMFKGQALKRWHQWRKQSVKKAYYFGDEAISAIVGRYCTYALKFGIILSAINDSWGVIDEETMTTAINLADNYKTTVHKLLDEQQNYGVSGAKIQKIFAVIQARANGEGVTRRVICQFANMKTSEVQPVLDKLKEIGAVIVHKKGRAEKYVPAVQSLPAKIWR